MPGVGIMTATNQDPPVWDVLIIGGGTAGLAVAARLREHSPTDLYTDEEHRRMHRRRQQQQRQQSKTQLHPSTLVLDAHGSQWMTRWNTLFETYDIQHLRSPMFFHVDPSDRDSLLAMANHPVDNRAHELIELHGCVGKQSLVHTWEKKKQNKGHEGVDGRVAATAAAAATGKRTKRASNKRPNNNPEVDERDRKDFFTPSTKLFWDHCKSVVHRYGLEGMVRHDEVAGIKYAEAEDGGGEKIFTVTTKSGAQYRAQTVVSTIGYGLKPHYPPFKSLPPKDVCDAPQVTHSLRIGTFPDPHVRSLVAQRSKTTNVLVVGGGLTSAQLSDLAVRRGVSKVWHLMRGPLKVKPFDLDISWLGKYRNHAFSEFWTADNDEKRFEMIHAARQGGSLTPIYYKRLCEHVKRGRIELRTNTLVVDMVRDAERSKWRIVTEPEMADVPEFDWVYLATGPSINVQELGFLDDMRRDHPVADCGGLPCINASLMWNDDVPLFFNGRLAGLQMGPGSPNLIGARTGAERVADAIHRLFRDRKTVGGKALCEKDRVSDESHDENNEDGGDDDDDDNGGKDGVDDESGRQDYVMGIGSKYGLLFGSAE